MLNFAFMPVVSFIIQAVILAAFVVVFYSLKKMNQTIDRNEAERSQDLIHFTILVESMKDLLNKVDYSAPYKKTVEHAYDALAGSPAKSSQNAYEIECAILSLMDQLKQEISANNEEAIRSLCSEIENRVADRNRCLRLER